MENTKVFYVGFQRCGTKAFKNIVAQNGFETVSWQECEKNDWAENAISKNFKQIVDCPDFEKSNYYEDFPFHHYDFIKYLSDVFPSAKFIHVERNPVEWFASMISHSGGVNPGKPSLIHATYYERLDLWHALKERLGRPPNYIPLVGADDHYIKFYARENLRIRKYLSYNLSEDRYLFGRLGDESLYQKICKFIGFPNTKPTAYHESDKNIAVETIKTNFPFL